MAHVPSFVLAHGRFVGDRRATVVTSRPPRGPARTSMGHCYPYRDRKVRAFFAGGNGGQTVIGIPELDLLVAFFGGNYSDAATLKPQREFVPQHLLPAIRDGGAGVTSR